MIPRRRRAAIGSALLSVLVPVVFGGVLPWLITDHQAHSGEPAGWGIVGLPLVAAGITFLVGTLGQLLGADRNAGRAFPRTDEFVIAGLYRFVRNPLSLSVGAVIIGQAAMFRSSEVLVYAAAFAGCAYSFVTFVEQPALVRRYGARYLEYLNAVPGWFPRLTPWTPTGRVRGF